MCRQDPGCSSARRPGPILRQPSAIPNDSISSCPGALRELAAVPRRLAVEDETEIDIGPGIGALFPTTSWELEGNVAQHVERRHLMSMTRFANEMENLEGNSCRKLASTR